MKRILSACSLLALSMGIVAADEINGTLKNVSGNTFTLVKEVPKGSPKGTKGEEVQFTAAGDVKVAKATFNKKAKSYTVSDTLNDGLTNPLFKAKKGTKVHITTNGENKVTEILVVTKAAKKKKATE